MAAEVVQSRAWVADYLRARAIEGRIYPDEIVRRLPATPPGHPLAGEWRQRADSAGRLLAHLRARSPRHILEVGSGNGWLGAAIAAALPRAAVTGMEPNDLERSQATRVFRDRPNLRFLADEVTTAQAPPERPDVIVLASVIQYVADLPVLLRRLLSWIEDDPGGEIHILDSPLYADGDVTAARERTQRHYAAIGVPTMTAVYHHHTWRSLDGFRTDVRYRPDAIRTRVERRLLGRERSPFPWIRVRPGGRG
jgi:SAM-dependent methyltransferase